MSDYVNVSLSEDKIRNLKVNSPVRKVTATLAMRNAVEFLETIPHYNLPGDIYNDDDGDMVFNWSDSRDGRTAIIITITALGFLHYAAIFGDSDSYGTVRFFKGKMPLEISELLSQYYLQRERGQHEQAD